MSLNSLWSLFFLHIPCFCAELHQYLLSEDHVCGWSLGPWAERGGQDPLQTVGADFPAGRYLNLSL